MGVGAGMGAGSTPTPTPGERTPKNGVMWVLRFGGLMALVGAAISRKVPPTKTEKVSVCEKWVGGRVDVEVEVDVDVDVDEDVDVADGRQCADGWPR